MRNLFALAIAVSLTGCNPPESPAAASPASNAAANPAAAEPAQTAAPAAVAGDLASVLAGSWRSRENVARDAWRHPQETLGFFGVTPDMTVIEITPGGGWYSEILAPWLRAGGHYVGVLVDPSRVTSEGARKYYSKSNQELRDKLAAAPDLYDRAELVEIDLQAPVLGPPGSADAVLTFRNVHNWTLNGAAAPMFRGFHAVLKPGGVLGVVEHRADADVPDGDRSGYLSEAQVIAYATGAGFVLEEKSEINANPKDSKDHPNGVWTLPPVNNHEPADAAKYQAIGESDRMTLRFRKPL